jgi:superfamily II DNA/RNA helicase
LSTDAGGVGLNLQHAASIVVNMDLPWNPAVLEQRIGRVHRMDQARSVQVVNFVAEGTIEEGMLSTLAFKKSLFAGVLDGGEKEIFLEGTRLTKFMESVDAVTGGASRTASAVVEARPVSGDRQPQTARSDSAADQRPSPTVAGDRKAQPPISAQPAPAAPGQQPNAGAAAFTTDPWAELLDAGLKLIETFATEQGGNAIAEPATSAQWIETDPHTGKSYMKLPIPEPDKVRRVTEALSGLIASLKR